MTTFTDAYVGVLATIGAHAQAQDDGRIADMAALYWPGGVVVIPGIATLEGAEAIAAAFSSPAWLPDQSKPQRHIVTNTVITEWDGARLAKATSDVAMIKSDGDGTPWTTLVVARYHDEFEENNGRWLIRRRTDEYVAWTPPAS